MLHPSIVVAAKAALRQSREHHHQHVAMSPSTSLDLVASVHVGGGGSSAMLLLSGPANDPTEGES